MKLFGESEVKSLKKLDYSKYEAQKLCSSYQDSYPNLFENDTYTVFERRQSGISAFLHANDSADEWFSVLLNLTYNNHNNIEQETLYGKKVSFRTRSVFKLSV